MRNMSFALTTEQIIHRAKWVTRRMGWLFLRVGDRLCAVEKCQGLKKGETVRRLAIIEVVDVRREPLRRLLDEPQYGSHECALEGFQVPEYADYHTPETFVPFFCATHRGCTPETIVTRIEFEYVEESGC